MVTYRSEFPSSLESAGCARRALVIFAQTVGLTGRHLLDFEYAVGEATANAAEHGHSEGSCFFIEAHFIEEKITVEITDCGSGFVGWNDLDRFKLLPGSPRGFGISLMRTFVDSVEYSDGGRRIRLEKKIPGIDAAVLAEAHL
jgi:anti-sigma regulatory factor (Ser/Thr protein kinase)